MADPGPNIRTCTPDDLQRVSRFVESCPPLERHTGFTYWVTFNFWGDTCFVATEGDEIVGYASGVGAGTSPDLIYIWQVGVAERYRGNGLSRRLISKVAEAAREKGFRRANVSIAPDNAASLSAFRRVAADLGHELEAAGEVSFRDPEGHSVEEVLYSFGICSEERADDEGADAFGRLDLDRLAERRV